jgi:hypothetical protein
MSAFSRTVARKSACLSRYDVKMMQEGVSSRIVCKLQQKIADHKTFYRPRLTYRSQPFIDLDATEFSHARIHTDTQVKVTSMNIACTDARNLGSVSVNRSCNGRNSSPLYGPDPIGRSGNRVGHDPFAGEMCHN